MAGSSFDPNNLYIVIITKEGGFIQIHLKLIIKTSEKYHKVSFSVADPPNLPQSPYAKNSSVVTRKYVIIL